MQDMMKMYSMGGSDMGMFADEGQTLILNAKHPLVQYVQAHQDDKKAQTVCAQLYDLAKIQNAPLTPDEMSKFVARTNEIMMILTGAEETTEKAEETEPAKEAAPEAKPEEKHEASEEKKD